MKKNIFAVLFALVVIIISGTSMQAYAADVTIPDVNFKTFLVTNYDTNHDGEIQESEAQAVTGTMDTPGIRSQPGNISDLTGIEAFTNMSILHCGNEQLTSLDVSHNTNLTYLNCDSNQLTSLDVSNSLTRLHCYDNQLTNLDVSNYTSLTDLLCDFNQLTSLDISNNTNLTRLACSFNPLNSLDVSNNKNLTSLSCGFNQLISLDVDVNISLTNLNCSFNSLTSLDISTNTSLEWLNCEYNQLADIPDITSCSSMQNYDCSYNNFGYDDCSTIAAIKAMDIVSFIYNPQNSGTLCCPDSSTDLSFNNGGVQVFSEHRVYDSCFTYGEVYYTILSAVLSSPSGCNPKAVRLSSPGNEWILPFLPGWSNHSSYTGKLVFAKGIGSPVPEPGPYWEEKTYLATVDCDNEMYSTFTPPAGTYHQLDVPVTVNVTNGVSPSASWSEVAGVDKYSVRLFPLRSNGNPDMATLVYDSGLLVTPSHTLTGLEGITPGCYALCIESRDYLDPPLEDKLVNRSRYLTRIFVGECNDQAFVSTNVYSEHRVYDDCFTNDESCFMKIGAVLSGSCTPHPVRVEWDGDNSEVLTPWPEWSCCSFAGQYVFSKNFGALGPDWEDKTYNFSVDCNPGVTDSVTIPEAAFYCLDAPGNVVVTNGSTPSVTWLAVPEADFYKVRLYPLNNDGNPDSAILLYDSGRLTSLSHILSGLGTLQPGMYCLSVESQDMNGERLINRGRYYTNLALGDNPGTVFDSVHVFSEHRVFGSCFSSSENSFTGMAAVLSTGGEFPSPVRVLWDTGDAVLRPTPGYSCCQYEGKYVVGSGFGAPPIGTDWEDKTYTFTVDYDPSATATVTIPAGTFNLLDAPATVTVVPGRQPTVSWSAVAGADAYEIRLHPLNNNGDPDTETLVYDSGELLVMTHTLTNLNSLAPGCYALCLESRESEGSRLINRSRYYTKVLINCFRHSHSVDFNSDGNHDIALFSPANHKWYIKDQSTPTYGTTDCLPIPGDYDGDGETDLAVVDLTRPDNRAKWYLNSIGVFIYGLQEWIPVPGDYDGDGVTDAALFDPNSGKWYVRGQFVTTYGAGGIPVPGDYNGDGTTDIAVFYPTNNKWYVKDVGTYTYGMADCIPVPADYDGDDITDLAVIDTSRPDGMAKWYIRNQAVFIYGAVANTIPVPGDYDGDGDADPCLFYQNTGKWYCRNIGGVTYGNSDMIPLAGNLATRYAISETAGGNTVW